MTQEKIELLTIFSYMSDAERAETKKIYQAALGAFKEPADALRYAINKTTR